MIQIEIITNQGHQIYLPDFFQTKKILLCALVFFLPLTAFAQKIVSIYNSNNTPMVNFALNDLKDELYSKKTIIRKTDISDVTLLLLTEADKGADKTKQVKYPEIDSN